MILDMEMKCENPEKRKDIYSVINKLLFITVHKSNSLLS